MDGEIGIVHALQTVFPDDPSKVGDKHAADLQDVLDIRFFLDGTLAGQYSAETLQLINEILQSNDQEPIDISDDEVAELSKAAKQLDYVGVNYYFSKFMKAYNGPHETIHNGTGKKGSSVNRLHGIGEQVTHADIPTTDWDWPIYKVASGENSAF